MELWVVGRDRLSFAGQGRLEDMVAVRNVGDFVVRPQTPTIPVGSALVEDEFDQYLQMLPADEHPTVAVDPRTPLDSEYIRQLIGQTESAGRWVLIIVAEEIVPEENE
jgi:hypothetical protein